MLDARIGAMLVLALLGVGCERQSMSTELLAEMGASCVVIVIDAAAAEHVHAYGYPRGTTPGIDALAETGVLFERAYAQAPSTILSVPSYLTGLQPYSIAVRRDAAAPSPPVYLPQIFEAAGFRTAGFSQNLNVGMAVPADEIFQHFDGFVLGRGSREQLDGATLVARALDWIDEQPDAQFFVYLHLLPPHGPYDPAEKHRLFQDAPYEGTIFPSNRVLSAVDRGRIDIGAEDLAFIVSQYDANLHLADSLVQSVIAGLDDRGLSESTLVVLTSDHGEAFGQHGRFLHNTTLYDEMLRVPLVFSFPDGAGPTGVRVREAVALVDLAPTLEGLFGLGNALADGADGRSLAEFVPQGAEPGPVPIFAQREDAVMVLKEHLKLILPVPETSGEAELYDLRTDVAEMRNLASARGGEVGGLRPLVSEMLDGRVAGLGLVEALIQRLPGDAVRQLQALGYVGDDEAPAAAPP